jgi:hypothetical protein
MPAPVCSLPNIDSPSNDYPIEKKESYPKKTDFNFGTPFKTEENSSGFNFGTPFKKSSKLDVNA